MVLRRGLSLVLDALICLILVYWFLCYDTLCGML